METPRMCVPRERLCENAADGLTSCEKGREHRETKSLTALFWTCNLQNHEKVTFCCLNHRVWCFIMATLANTCKGSLETHMLRTFF